MIGHTISRYKILEKLGEGGMGVVYKCQDLKLDRLVALKFLPHHLTVNHAEKARFLQEAKAAAILNHPNVCVIYSIEEAEDKQFIVMEYVDGMTLREKTLREGEVTSPSRVNDVITYAIQIGEALHEAHSKGIVHRDIKCENIMVNSRNQIKVMDFGLAKLKGSLKLTKTSSTVGTLAYMAPEQIQGGEVDARSDIFSFGVVLFEMLTGRMPFRGEHDAAIMYSILNEEPDPLTKYLPDASPELLHILNRALEKDPADRYQNVNDMVIDLRRTKKDSGRVSRGTLTQIPVPQAQSTRDRSSTVSQPHARPSTHMKKLMLAGILVVAAVGVYFLFFRSTADSAERLPIAVADFVNETKEPELDGLSGMLITAMEQSRRLAVLPRSQMFDILRQSGKGNVDRIDEALGREICGKANINALLTASIRKFGKLYTIDLKVLDPSRNQYLFTAKEDGEGQESIPAMLDRLSEKTRLGLKEQANEVRSANQKVASVTTSNLEAYQYFFQGEQLINRLKFEEAVEQFKNAVVLDPKFGLAYYRMAYALSWNNEQRAAEPIRKAMNLIDRMPEKEGYLVRAEHDFIEYGLAAGLKVLHEMERIYPDEKEMLYNIGDWSYHTGLYEEAARYLERVLKMDPTDQRALQHLSWTYRDAGMYPQFLDIAKRYASSAGSAESYSLLGNAFSLADQANEGIKILRSTEQLFPNEASIKQAIAALFLSNGDYAKAEEELKLILTASRDSDARYTSYSTLSSFYLLLGRYRDANRSLDLAIAEARRMDDTTKALTAQMWHALNYAVTHGDADRAWRELEPTLNTGAQLGDVYYRGGLTLMMIGRKEYQSADSSVMIPGMATWWRYSVKSIIASNRRSCDLARAFYDSVGTIGESGRLWSLYPLAVCQFESGQLDLAMATLREMVGFKDRGRSAAYYLPKAMLLLGKVYEKKGNPAGAKAQYTRLLDLWKNADKDLPDYIEARTRLQELGGVASK